MRCTNCGHDHTLHHALGCDGNLASEEAYWKTFETLPGYDQTREAISELEARQPKPCPCSEHRFNP